MLTVLPAVNATLNATSGILLLIAFVLIKRKRIAQHRRFMLAACYTSLAFLVCYVANHYLRHGVVTRFQGTGAIRPIYFTILTSHTFLAILVAPFVVVTLRRGLKGNFDAHKKLARLVFPVWLYVSVTGVIVYLLLYQFYPAR